MRGRKQVKLVAKVRRFQRKPNITEHKRTQMSYTLSYTLGKVSYTLGGFDLLGERKSQFREMEQFLREIYPLLH